MHTEELKMKKLLSVLLALCMVTGSVLLTASAGQADTLRCKEDGTFTILQITDPQDDAAPAKGLLAFIEKSIALTQPDLIVLTGDIVEDDRFGDLTSDDEPFKEGVSVEGDLAASLANVRACVEQIFAPLEKSGIPYAVTLGNNDYKSGITTADWLAIFAEYPGCITVDMSADDDGHIDQYLPVLASDSQEAAFGLWLLDNGKGFNEQQRSWMLATDNGGVPGVVFEHIPTRDVHNLFEECSPWDSGAFAEELSVYRLQPALAYGHAESALADSGSASQADLWKEKNVIGAFFGHLHTSGFTGTYDGVTMGLTYGCQFAKAGPYGVRTVVLDENSGSLQTELYTYEKDAFVLQTQDIEQQPQNAVQAFFKGFVNTLLFVMRSVCYLLKF